MLDANRNMVAQVDPLGRRCTWVYNGDGTLQASVDPRGLATNSGVTYRMNTRQHRECMQCFGQNWSRMTQ